MMYTLRITTLAALSLYSVLAYTLALPAQQANRKIPGTSQKQPFTKLVAFGDGYSDDGNGSWAHGLDPNNLFLQHTWTDGPVAVTYLANLLNVPLMSYAWGGANGNGLAGSTLDNNYTLSTDTYQGNPVPSTAEQIKLNYTLGGPPSDISSTLHIIWAGVNDLRAHTNVQNPNLAQPDNIHNIWWYGNYTNLLRSQAEYLIQSGSPAVVVVNLFPYQRTPANNYLWCKNSTRCTNQWSTLIQTSNSHLQAGLAASPYANNIIYYDIWTFWNRVMNNKDSYGYNQPIDNFCNGNSNVPEWSWPTCSKNKWSSARPFFWFTLCNPETSMHNFIAQDIQSTVTQFLKQR